MSRIISVVMLASWIVGAALLSGCAMIGGSDSPPAETPSQTTAPTPAAETPAEPAAPAAAASAPARVDPYTVPPDGSPFSKVVDRSSEIDVRKILGEPDQTTSYMTGKIFIPFYFGKDAYRTDWMYEGQGRIVFSRGAWGDQFKVIAVKSNSNEMK